MEKNLKRYKPCFSFIPPHIMGALAREGVEEARFTIHQSRLSRVNRSEKNSHYENIPGNCTGRKCKSKCV